MFDPAGGETRSSNGVYGVQWEVFQRLQKVVLTIINHEELVVASSSQSDSRRPR
jgi:hypothetical protein